MTTHHPTKRYRLYCVGGSGNSFKVALFLNCAGLDWEPVGVDLAGGQNRDPAWRAATNAMGEVPVLEVDGRRMSQSGAILAWLAEAHGAFGPLGDEETFETMRWLLFDNHKFTGNFAAHRALHSKVLDAPSATLAYRRSFRHACLHESADRKRPLDRRQASRPAPLHAGRPADDRGFLPDGIPLLPERGDRLRSRLGLSGDRCLARPRGRPAGVEATL
jgi:glutathione S-transferase